MGSFDRQDLFDIVEGSMLLACGGGGTREFSKFMLQCIFYELEKKGKTEVTYVDPAEGFPCSTAAVFGLMGFPKGPERDRNSGEDYENLIIKSLEKIYNLMKKEKNVQEIIPLAVETGPLGILTAVLLSAVTGIPVADCDCGGRAYPKIGMCTLNASEASPSPAILSPIAANAETKELHVKTYSSDCNAIEQICSSVVSSGAFLVEELDAYGGFLALFPAPVSQIKDSIITNTITKCRDIGKMMRESKEDPVGAIVERYNGQKLFHGEVIEIDRKTVTGFQLAIVSIRNSAGEIARIKCMNENFIIWIGDKDKIEAPLFKAPDLICYMTPHGEALNIFDMEKGTDVDIIGFKADQKLYESKILEAYNQVLKDMGYKG